MRSAVLWIRTAIVAALAVVLSLTAAQAQATITIWHTESNAKTKQVFQEIIDAYEKANPGKKVVQEAVGWAALNNKLQTAIATGALPDATQLEVSVGRSFMYKQLLRPMDDLLESVGRENVYPAVRALMVDERDGKTYGVSHAIGVNLLTYRKDFLKAAGLPEVAPKTFAEWLTMLKALTVDTNGDGRPDRFGLSISGTGHNINKSLYTFVASNGGRLFDENGKPALTEPQVVEALRFFKEIADCCLAPDWLSRDFLGTMGDLSTGKAAMIMGWGRGAGFYEQYAPDVVARGDIGVFDTKPIGPSGKAFMTQFDSEAWAVFKAAKNGEEAVKFLKFFFQPENYIRYLQTAPIHLLPVSTKILADDRYKATPDFTKWKFWVDAQNKVISRDNPKPLLLIQESDMKLPFIGEIGGSTILVDMVTDVVRGGMTPEAAAARAQQRAEQLISQLGYKKW